MKTESNDLDLRRFGRIVKKNWWLYAVTLAVMLSLAGTYAVVRMPVYTSHATMLIENSSPDASAAMAAAGGKAASAMRLFAMASGNVTNEIYLINSNDVLSRTVRRCGLNTTYVARNGLYKSMIYPQTQTPVAIEINPLTLDTLSTGLKVKVRLHDGKADIETSGGFMGMRKLANADGVKLPHTVKTPYCTFKVVPTSAYDPAMDSRVDISMAGTQSVISALHKKLTVEIDDKTADAITLTVDDDKKRGRDLLNVLMDEYNTKRLERTRETARNELNYCNDRLNILMQQLSESEEKVERFKRDNNLLAMAIDSGGWMGKALGSRAALAQQQSELTYYDQVLYTLNHDKDGNTFLPSSLDGRQADPLVMEYNELVAQKRELQRAATDENPALISVNDRLRQMRSTITSNFTKVVDVSKRNLSTMYELRDEATGNMGKFPGLERELFNLLRDKTIKNELYLYLLQRREAAELKLSSTETMGFVVDESYTDVKPSLDKTFLALAIALLFTLLAPTLLLFIIMRRRDSLHEPMDTAFIGVEESTLCGTPTEAARALRGKLLTDNERRILLVADTGADHSLATHLADSLLAIGRKVVVSNISDGADDNDVLLSTEFEAEMESARENGEYLIASVPLPEKLREIVPLVDCNDVALIVTVQRGKMTRKQLRRLLSGQQSEHVIVCILS